MSAKRAAFFFGSGISFRSGGPTVDTISDKLLNGSWADHSDWRFNPANGRSSDAAKRIQQFLHILKAHIDPHLRSHDDRESNYEDLYAAALQIVQDETCEIVNPLLAATVRIIRDATKDLYQHLPPHIDNNRFASLADRASDLIQWVVYHTIARAKRPSGLEPLAAMARATASMNIFSLNHDLLIERQLDADMIPFSDGFSEVDGDVVRFNWSWNEKVPLRLYKLHGSVDWYRFRFPAYVQYGKVHGDPEHCKNANGRRLRLLNPEPLFLTGTTVKEQSYGYSLVGELFAEFRLRLRSHHSLICCGYGWEDKGINIRLRQWLYDAPQNRIVILHNASPDELKQKRFWYFYWDDFTKTNKVIVIPKWLSECAVSDLESYFDN